MLFQDYTNLQIKRMPQKDILFIYISRLIAYRDI